MKYVIAVALAGAFAVQGAHGASPNDNDIRVVSVQGASVCTRIGRNAPPTCFTHGGGQKSDPVWSLDGERIAFVEFVPPDGPFLARLWIVDRHGQRVHSAHIKEVGPNEVRGGMRFVDRVQWITSSKVVVGGSVNPSTAEYIVYDAASGRAEDDFWADGFGAAFHPRTGARTHFIDAPHFALRSERATKLVVDGKVVVELWKMDLSAAGKPQWSADGENLAIPVEPSTEEDATVAAGKGATRSRASLLLFNQRSGKASVLALPPKVPADYALYWLRDTIIVANAVAAGSAPATPAMPGRLAMGPESWQISLANAKAGRATGWRHALGGIEAVPEIQAAKAKSALRKELMGSMSEAEGDVWCGACVVRGAPR